MIINSINNASITPKAKAIPALNPAPHNSKLLAIVNRHPVQQLEFDNRNGHPVPAQA